MSEATGSGNMSTAGTMNGVEATLLTVLADLRGEVTDLKNQVVEGVAAMSEAESEKIAQLRQELKTAARTATEREREEARHNSEQNEKRIQALTQELRVMTHAAIEREREYSRRDVEWNEKVLQATTLTHAAKVDAIQLGDRLTKAERASQQMSEKAEQHEGRLRTQRARIGELEGALHAASEKIRALESERNLFEKRAQELSFSRSRRVLLKLHLVSRCAWETP
jgi:chromosome segregation ATPase